MSSNLYWRPAQPEPDGEPFGYGLKFSIAERLLGVDASLSSEWTTVDANAIPFLEGVASASNTDVKREAKALIKLINKHGAVELRLY